MARPSTSVRELAAGASAEGQADEQDFNDTIETLDRDAPEPGAYASEEMQREMEQVEQLDVLEGLRALQVGDPITWRIYRVGSTDADLNGFLETWSTSQLTQDRLRDEFGGGTYRIRGTYANGKFAAGRTIRIAGDAKRKEKVMSQPQSAFNLGEFLAQQEARDAARRQELQDQRERERKEADEKEDRRRRERNELLAIVMPAVTGLTTAVVGAFSANRGPDLAALIAAMKGPDPITVLTQLKALERNSDSAMTKILPMLIDMAGDKASGGDTGWLDVMKELAKTAGPTIGGLIETSVQTARANAAAQAALPPMSVVPQASPTAPALTAPPPLIVVPESVPRRDRRTRFANGAPPVESPPPSTGGVATAGASSGGTIAAGQADMNLIKLLPHLPWLKEQLFRMGQAAVKGRDPELYAALFLEELPDGIGPDVVGQLLAREDWYAQLCQVEPRMNRPDIVPWFTAARNAILQSLEQELGAAVGAHAPATASPDPRARTVVEVRGPEAAGNSAPVQPAASAPKPAVKEPGRPTQLPSLTGD